MTFARPEFLGLLAVVPIYACCLWLAGMRRRRAGVFFPGMSRNTALRRLKAGCALAGVTLLALGAAGPSMGRVAVNTAPPPRLRLVVALDCSRSMLARDLAPDRLGAAKNLIREILAGLPHVAAGLVGFSGRAWLACPVTADRPALALFLDALSPQTAPLGGTSVAAALEACRLALAGAAVGAILLVSDGEDTLSVRDAALWRPGDTPVFTVAVGGAVPVAVPLSRADGGGVLRDTAGQPVLVGVDAAGLKRLAEEAGGRFFHLAPQMPSPAGDIAAVLAALAPRARDTATTLVPADRSPVFYAAGLVLLLLDMLLVPAGRAVLSAVLVFSLLATDRAYAADDAREAVTRGIEALAAGEIQAALDAFLAARVWRPDSPEILYNIGTAFYRLGRYAEAGRMFARAAHGGGPDALRARAFYNQGNAACRQGDGATAGRLYEAALALDPADDDARANLDWLHSREQGCRNDSRQADADEKERSPGPSPDAAAGGEGRTDTPGQAPAPVGRDADKAGQSQAETSPVAAGAPSENRPGQASVPLAGSQGRKAGEKQARTAGKPGDSILDRVPDLAGLPDEAPQYGRPTVEKDW